MAEPNLKPGWQTYRFDQIAINVNERVEPGDTDLEYYVGLEHLDGDSLKIRRWGTPDDVEATKLRFKKGDIIFGRRRVYQRKLAVADFDGICSAHAMVLRPKTDVVLPEFLPFFMQSDLFMNRALEISVGSLSPTINWKTLAAQEFPLPPPDEQRRLVEVFNTFHSAIEAYHDAIKDGERLLRSLQRQHFIELPEGQKVKIGQVADVRNGTTPSRKRPDYWDGTIPWLPTGKVNERVIQVADEFITEKALSECSLTVIPTGSTLVAMIGQGFTRGKVAMLTLDACINQNFGAIIPSEDLDSWYLFYHLDILYDRLRGWSHGTNQHALNCALLREFPIWLPSLERQIDISANLIEIENAIQTCKNRLANSNVLLTSLREDELTG